MTARSLRPGSLRAARIMYQALVILAYSLVAVAAAPASYDQRQDGEFNVRADVQNVVFLIAIPQKMSIPMEILEGLVKFKTNGREAQDRSDVHTMEAFVEPSTPYRVEIGPESSDRSVEGDGRAVEVVIASRRRTDEEAQPDKDEYKLLGAIEQCGPDRERDPVTLTCRFRSVAPEIAPQLVPASS